MHIHSAIFEALPLRGAQEILSFACICWLAITLAGCARSTVDVSFEGLCGLTYAEFASFDEEFLIQWVQENYGVSPWKLGETKESGKVVTVHAWMKDGTYGTAWLNDGHLAVISMMDIQNGPTFGQVVDTVGPPDAVDSYVTRQEDTVYTIELHYPTLGFIAVESGWKRGYVTSLTLERHMRVNEIYCHMPGSMQEVLQEAFVIPPENVPIALQRRIPWPGFGTSIPLGLGNEP